MEEIIGVLNDIVWSDALIVLCLGIYFHSTRFADTSLRKCLFGLTESSESEFLLQALSMSLAEWVRGILQV
jgi:AGCS family alanine or glycine:cation symporter